jgi:hypothetical protein
MGPQDSSLRAGCDGFDSFVGLPHAWGGTEKGAGAFDMGAKPPELSVSNVEFHVGWFDDAIPAFAQQHSGPLAFAHLDADHGEDRPAPAPNTTNTGHASRRCGPTPASTVRCLG